MQSRLREADNPRNVICVTSEVRADQHEKRAAAADITLEDVRCEFGERWEITCITGGYRAISRDWGGHTPIPRYGRTLAELAESIRMMEPRP
jgi:hypothetical protein